MWWSHRRRQRSFGSSCLCWHALLLLPILSMAMASSSRLSCFQWPCIQYYISINSGVERSLRKCRSSWKGFVKSKTTCNVCLNSAPRLQRYIELSCELRPEALGVVSALVYMLTVIVFIPFPFYKDIVAATSDQEQTPGTTAVTSQGTSFMEEGRVLHRFPHSKV